MENKVHESLDKLKEHLNRESLTVDGVQSISEHATRRKFITSLGKPFDNVIQHNNDGLLNWNEISWLELREHARTILSNSQLSDRKGGGSNIKNQQRVVVVVVVLRNRQTSVMTMPRNRKIYKNGEIKWKVSSRSLPRNLQQNSRR